VLSRPPASLESGVGEDRSGGGRPSARLATYTRTVGRVVPGVLIDLRALDGAPMTVFNDYGNALRCDDLRAGERRRFNRGFGPGSRAD